MAMRTDAGETRPPEPSTAEFLQKRLTRSMAAWPIRRLVRARYVLFLLALITSVFIYRYVIDLVDSRNEFDFFGDVSRVLTHDQYKIFSGSEGGFYIEIGNALERRTRRDSPIDFVNEPSSGALDNARSVASHSKSFGLLQEDTLEPRDFLREHLRYITPLYLERMHVIYDADRLAAIQKAAGVSPDDARPLMLRSSSAPEDEARQFFEHADVRISTGPVGSGSRLFARFLLSQCNIGDYTDEGLGFGEGLRRLDRDFDDPMKVDVVFTIAGAPLASVRETLEKHDGGRFRLMSIDPAVVSPLREKHDLRLQNASFMDKYEDGESVSTFGTWAFLVASRDVSDDVAMDALAELDRAREDIRASTGLDKRDADSFQLAEFNFYETFKGGHTEFKTRFARNSLIFVTFVSVVATIIVMFLSWVVSGFNRVRYYRSLIRVYGELPENTNLEDGVTGFPEPVIYTDQKEIVASLVRGMSDLLTMARQVRESYNYGELSMNHYSLLLSTVDNLKSVFQRNLNQRLNEYYANYGEYEPVVLRHYHTAGYLSAEDFHILNTRYGSEATAAGATDAEEESTTAARSHEPSGHGPRMFISYRREDSDFAAGRIRERLVEEFGDFTVFQDSDMPAGRDFREVIEGEIARCDVVLAIIGTQWTSVLRKRSRSDRDDYMRIELETALELGIPIVPVVLAPAQIPGERDLPESLRDLCYLHAVTVRPDPEFQVSVDRLVEALAEVARNRPQPNGRTTSARVRRARKKATKARVVKSGNGRNAKPAKARSRKKASSRD